MRLFLSGNTYHLSKIFILILIRRGTSRSRKRATPLLSAKQRTAFYQINFKEKTIFSFQLPVLVEHNVPIRMNIVLPGFWLRICLFGRRNLVNQDFLRAFLQKTLFSLRFLEPSDFKKNVALRKQTQMKPGPMLT